MPKLDVYNLEKKKVGSVDLSDDVFSAYVNESLVHQVVKAQLAGRRQGTAKTKTRTHVRGGGKKPFKQKGSGNARRGSNRSPLMVGGGTMHGPVPRDYSESTPKEMMRGALRSILSDRVKANRLIVLDEVKLAEPKTGALDKALDSFREGEGVQKLLLVDEQNQNLELSGRNIPNVKVLRTEGINVYDVIRSDWVLISKKSAQAIEGRLSGQEKE